MLNTFLGWYYFNFNIVDCIHLHNNKRYYDLRVFLINVMMSNYNNEPNYIIKNLVMGGKRL